MGTTALSRPTVAESFRAKGTALLWTGLAGGGAAILLGVWYAPDLLFLLPALLVGAAAVVLLLKRPLAHLCVTLLASALILQHKPGVQVEEVLYGLYALFFLVTWALRHRLVEGQPLIDSAETRMMALFLGIVLALVPLSFLHGATPHTVVRELTSLALIGFFFPVRDACRRSPEGLRALIGVALVLLLFVVVRNVMLYREIINNAERLVDMVRGRVVASEHILAAGSLFGAVFLLFARNSREAAAAAVVFVASFGALLLSMSRGFWLAFLWGCLLVFWVIDGRRRARILVMSVLAGVAIASAAFLFFGDFAQAYLAGLLDRFGSVQGSTTRDISMLGRIYEGRAALREIALTPLLGHGVGVPFTFSTILTRTEITTTFIHNGYIYLWYAFGVPGAVLMIVMWWRGIGAGLSAFRAADANQLQRLAGLAAAAALFCYTLSAMTSNPFWHKDYILGFGFLLGLAYGTRSRRSVGPVS